jgi:hypothetical protein
MKRRFLFSIVAATLMVSVVHAGLAPTNLPSSSYYQGRHDKTFNLDSGDTIKVRLEFAVYQGEDADIMRDITGYTGETTGYVYAYQIFSDSSSTAALTAFSLTGVNPNAISSVTDDIGQAESITYGYTYESDGVEPTAGYFNDSVDEAIWEFENGTLVQGESSWFLFLYSDYSWVKGDLTVQAAVYDDDIPVPDGGGNSNIPEPATLLLLAGGTLLSLKRKK